MTSSDDNSSARIKVLNVAQTISEESAGLFPLNKGEIVVIEDADIMPTQPLHPPSIFVGNSPYLRGTKFVPQHDMTSFDMFFLDWSKLQRSKLRQLCSLELFVNLRRIRGHEEHALVRAYTSSSTTCPPIGGTHRKNIIEVALCFRFTLRPT